MIEERKRTFVAKVTAEPYPYLKIHIPIVVVESLRLKKGEIVEVTIIVLK